MKIDEKEDGMGEYAIIETDNPRHHVHVSEREGKLSIYVYDHLNITIDGHHKEEPSIHVYSDEWPTQLMVSDPEYSFTNTEIDK